MDNTGNMTKKIILTILAFPAALILNSLIFLLIGMVSGFGNGLDTNSSTGFLKILNYALLIGFIGIFIWVIWYKKKK